MIIVIVMSYIMQRLLTISLLAVHILGNTEFGQLIHLPKIFEHYKWHHHLDPSVSFITFVSQHYFGDDGMVSDNSDDSNLPFKQLHQPVTTHIIISQPFVSFKFNGAFTANKKVYLPYSSTPLSGYMLTLLQPPDLAI